MIQADNNRILAAATGYVIGFKVGETSHMYKNEGRSNLAIPAPFLDCAAKSIRLHGPIGLREREPCGSRTLFRPRRKGFTPCGSIEIREHPRLAACAPSSTVPWSLFSTARPERPDLTVCASSFDSAREFLRSKAQSNRKRLNLATPAPSFRLRRKVFGPCGSIEH